MLPSAYFIRYKLSLNFFRLNQETFVHQDQIIDDRGHGDEVVAVGEVGGLIRSREHSPGGDVGRLAKEQGVRERQPPEGGPISITNACHRRRPR